jgi:hypothetical protein
MKAVVRETYGPPDVLHLAEVPTPALRDGNVLVKVRAPILPGVEAPDQVGVQSWLTTIRGACALHDHARASCASTSYGRSVPT